MKPIIAIAVAALVLGAAVASANPAHHAQPARPTASGAGPNSTMGTPGTMMGGHVEGSLAFIKTELKISDAQASAWSSFAEAYRAFAASKPAMMMQGGGMMGGGMMGGGSGGMASSDGTIPQGQSAMSYPDRMKVHMQMMEEHLEAGKKFEPAVEAFYAALSTEQRKTADELLPMFTMMGRMM